MKSWVKLYTEIARDVDMGTLTWEQRGIWSYLLALCGELDIRDDTGAETGELDSLARIAWHIRCDTKVLSDAIAAFAERGMVEERDGILFLPNYAKRQARAPSARRDAVASRVRKHRSETAECNEDVTTLQRGVTPSDPDPDPDPDPDAESDAEGEPFSVGTSDEFASTNPTPSPPRIKPKAWPESVRIYREETKKRPPNDAAFDAISETIAPNEASFALWRSIVHAALLQGWKWQNVAAMIDHYNRGEIPGERRGGGPSPPLHSSETGFAAIARAHAAQEAASGK